METGSDQAKSSGGTRQGWRDDFIEYWASDVGARVSVAFGIGCVQNSMSGCFSGGKGHGFHLILKRLGTQRSIGKSELVIRKGTLWSIGNQIAQGRGT